MRAHLIWNKLQPSMLCDSNGIYRNHTLFEVLHYDFLFSIQGGGQGCFFQMSASKIQRRSCLK